MKGLALTRYMHDWLSRWLREPDKRPKLLSAITKRVASMPLWEGTAYRIGDGEGSVWHKTLLSAQKVPASQRAGTNVYHIKVKSAIDVERVALFLSEHFPDSARLFKKFASFEPLIVLDTSAAKRVVTKQDVDWGDDEEPQTGDPSESPSTLADDSNTEEWLRARFAHGFASNAPKIEFMRHAWDVFNATLFEGKLDVARKPDFLLAVPARLRGWHGKGGVNFKARGIFFNSIPETKSKRGVFMHPRTFLADWATWRTTFVHELCHEAVYDNNDRDTAIKDGLSTGGHGPLWQAWMRKVGLSPDRYDSTDTREYMMPDEELRETSIRQARFNTGLQSKVWAPGDSCKFVDVTKPDSELTSFPDIGVVLAKARPRAGDKKHPAYFLMMREHITNPGAPLKRVLWYDMGMPLSTGSTAFSENQLRLVAAMEHVWYDVFLHNRALLVK